MMKLLLCLLLLVLCLLFPPFYILHTLVFQILPVAVLLWLFYWGFSPGKPKDEKKLLISSPNDFQVVWTRQQLLFDKSFAEKNLTKSLVGSVIQNAVCLKEVSAKDALEWLVKTDKAGPLEGYRSLPAELQNRLAEKICENLAE